jgi:putative ATP-binding cassette transporter
VALCLALPVTRFISGYLLVKLSQRAIYDLRLALSRRILAAPLRKLEEVGTSRLLATLTDDVMAISDAAVSIPFFAMQIAIVIGCLGFLAWLSPAVFGGVFAFLVLAVTLLKLMEGTAGSAFTRARESQDDLFAHFRDLTEGNKELKLHRRRRQAFREQLLEPTADEFRRNQVKGRMIYNLVGSWSQVLFFGLLGLIIFALPLLMEVEVSVQMGYIITILYIVGPIESIMNSIMPSFMRAGIALRKVESLGLSLDESITETEAKRSPQPLQWSSIALQGTTHVYLREGEDSTFTLGPVDLRFDSGETVFLVGGNGSGKTTLAKLITGLYTPEQGEICVDDEPVTDANRDLYRQLFSVVFTDFHLFDRLLGLEAPEIDDRAEFYLGKLRLLGKVSVEEGKLSTLEVSQGQRKRLALLTAYLEDRSVYLFDEWAADQDPEFKKVFYLQLLPELKSRGKTVIVISHDDHFYHLADRLVKLDEGQIEYDTKYDEGSAEMLALRKKVAV